LILAAAAGACSSDDTTGDGADSGAGGRADGSTSGMDARPAGDASTADGSLADAAQPDAARISDAAVEDCGRIKCDCTFNGIQLWGDVEYTELFPDIIVRVSPFPDLRVQRDVIFADSCGEWHEVTSSPDFTVQIVGELGFPDFEIQDSPFPGIP
jgi:hypothetical protein